MSDLPVGSIHISYDLADDGDILTRVDVSGDLPVVTILGLLSMATDTVLRGEHGTGEGDE